MQRRREACAHSSAALVTEGPLVIRCGPSQMRLGDTAALADHLQAESLLVAGWSGGGPAALACAALLPGRVRACITLASPAPRGCLVRRGTSRRSQCDGEEDIGLIVGSVGLATDSAR